MDYTLRRLAWTDEEVASIDLPLATMHIAMSFGSGLARRPGDPAGVVWAVGDRGPNLKPKTLLKRYGLEPMRALAEVPGAKVMPRLDLGPAIAKLMVRDDRVELIESIRLTDHDGRPISGLPVPGTKHALSEPAFDLGGGKLEPDPGGMDTEGIIALDDGTFWVGDEFGPSLVHIDASGRVLARHVPEGVSLIGARYPVYPTLPALTARRQLNRGFEGIAQSPDGKWLFLTFQSPLAHPDEAAHQSARHVRLWRLEASTLQVASQYLYPLDPPESFARDCSKGSVEWEDLKVSELLALDSDRLIVLERASETTKLYRINLSQEFEIPREHLDLETRPTIEELSSAGTLSFPPLRKSLLLSSDDATELPPDLEGMALFSPNELLLVNDNDFGVEGAGTSFWLIRFAAI